MDNFKYRQSFLGALNGAHSTFSEMFDEKLFVEDETIISGQIEGSCIQLPSNSVSDISASNDIDDIAVSINREKVISRGKKKGSKSADARISPDSLTRSQFQRVQHLFSYFAKMKFCSEKLHLLFHRGADKEPLGPDIDSDVVIAEAEVEANKLQEELLASNIREGKQLKIICALRDYLMIEINRSEDADTELKVAEDNLVKMTVERNKYFKIAQQLELNNIKADKGVKEDKAQGAQAVRQPTIPQVVFNSEIPELYCGSFVRKKFGNNFFFGLIVHFSAPFFKVIYEDSDEEELSYKELSACFWPSSVPSTKAAQCRRHAATLGLHVSSEFISEVEGTGTSDGLVHSSTSSSRSSSQSSGGSHSSSGTNGVTDEEINLDNSGSSSSSVTKKKRSYVVKEDKPEKERICSISTRYNGQRGSERSDKTRERQDVYDGTGSDSYELGSSAKKRMKIDVSAGSGGMSRRVRSSRVLEIPSSSQNPIDLCEDDSDVTTADTSDLPTGGSPDTPTSSDVAAEASSDVASEATAEVASDAASEATPEVASDVTSSDIASDVAAEGTSEVAAVVISKVVEVAAPEVAVTEDRIDDAVVEMVDALFEMDDTVVEMDDAFLSPVDAIEIEAVLLDPPCLKVVEALVVNCNALIGDQGLQTIS